MELLKSLTWLKAIFNLFDWLQKKSGWYIPNELIDQNVRFDYGKLRHFIILDRGQTKITNGNFSKLKQIIEEEEIVSNLVTGFPVKNMAFTENFISLLFYFGLLTFKETSPQQDEEFVLKIPNETIRRLHYSYIKEGYEETGVFQKEYGKDPGNKVGVDILRFRFGLYRLRFLNKGARETRKTRERHERKSSRLSLMH